MSINVKELAGIVEVHVQRQWNSWRIATYDQSRVGKSPLGRREWRSKREGAASLSSRIRLVQ